MSNVHFKKHLIHTCTIQRNAPSQSASGELVPSWTDAETGVPCRYVEKAERLADQSLSFQMLEDHIMLMSNGEDVREEDRVSTIVSKRDGSSVETGPFTVEAVLKRNSTRPFHISLKLERVE